MLKPDAWLSGILGKPVYHLSSPAEEFARPKGPAFLDAKVPVDEFATLICLQAQGFVVIDTNIQMARPAGELVQERARVRYANPGDALEVKRLAAGAFVYDRFHRDPALGHTAASRVKSEWAGNYFLGKRGDRMIVAEDSAGVCGFLQLLRGEDGATVIDLMAVDARSRRKGAAKSMIALAANAPGTGSMRVGTQIANTASLVLYAALGFRIVSASYVLHLHIAD